jgi:hypothetical protein
VEVEGVEEFRVGLTALTAPVPGHLVTQKYPLSAGTTYHFITTTTHACSKYIKLSENIIYKQKGQKVQKGGFGKFTWTKGCPSCPTR